MKNVYTACVRLFLLVVATVVLMQARAQTTLNTTAVSGFSNNNGSGMVLFNFQNTNGFPVTITDVESIVGTAGTTTAELWTRTTPLSGASYSGGISVSTGWTLAASGTFTGVVNTTTLTTQPILSGVSVVIPANTTYAMAIAAYSGTSGRLRYHTIVSPNIPATTVSAGGCNILMGNGSAGTPTNTSFGAASAPPGTSATFNNPRAFLGKITFTGSTSPCTSPPTPGAATINPATPICTGTPVALNLTSNSSGIGQTYVWQKSTNPGPPHSWTDISSSAATTALTVNPSVTTFYRAAVTCGGSTTYSDSVKVIVNPAFPAGTYTIDAGTPTSGTNFQTFADAITALNCGIAGPVVFNVVNGTYGEQVVIPPVGGTSLTNTITFKGNLATLAPTATQLVTGARYGIWLNGADHIIIDSLNVDVTSGTYGWGIMLTNQADSNIISNCTVTTSISNTTATNHIGIGINGASSSTATSGNNGNDNQILNNTINGGYYGIYLYGNSGSTTQNLRNIVRGNIIKDAYIYSIYSAYQTGVVISKNDISRPARTTMAASTTTTYGIAVTTGTLGAMVEKNRIYSMFDAMSSQAGTFYCIYVAAAATATDPNRFENNLIYNVGANAAVYGLYNTSAPYMYAYHNTIAFDDQAATNGNTYGFYQTGSSAGIDFRNNIVYISRSGTGIKRCLYFVTTTSAITSNNNVLFMNSSGGTDNKLAQYGTTSFDDLLTWKTANSSAYDQQSVSMDPIFFSTGSGDYTPTESLLDGIGANVGVTTDITGATRPANPDPGAYELPSSVGTDIKPTALVSPAVTAKGCYSTETITVTIKNNDVSSIDFSVKPVTVTVSVTTPGGATSTYSAVVNTGVLAAGASQNVTMVSPGATLIMTTAGNYAFAISTSVSGDVNTANNNLNVSRVKETLTPGTITSSQSSLCASGSPQLSSIGSNGFSSLQWQQSATSGTGYSNIAGATTDPYTVSPAITQTTYYQLVATCGPINSTSPEISVVVNNPLVTGTTPGQRCGIGTVNLSATTAASVLRWYGNSTGGTPLATGNNFTTPVINATTTYYVAAGEGGANTSTGVSAPNASATSGAGTTNFGMVFDVMSPFVLSSVTIYPVSASGATGTVTIDIINGAGTVIHTAIFNVTGSPAASPVPFVANLNFNVQPGTNYKIRPGFTGITGLLFGPSPSSSFNYGYPFVVPGVLSINTSTLTAAPTNTARNDLYYYFYDWQVVTGCEGSRVPVVATVTTPPALTVTASKTICNNAVHMLAVTSAIPDFNTYVWSPQSDLYSNASATIPYTGGNATQVYFKSATPAVTTYTVTANNTTSQCANAASSIITVLPDPTIAASVPEICVSGSSTLSLTPPSGYGDGILQWQNSANAVTYSDISGANSNTYTTPTLSQSTYYKLVLKDQSNVTCSEPNITVRVNNPQVTGTTPAARCGSGTVTLGGTGSVGSTLNWYTALTGGTAIASGNTFVTPVINSSTTYYVAATEGGGSTTHFGKLDASSTTGNTGYTDVGLMFDALTPFTLQSVAIYPIGTGGSATVTIALKNSAGTILQTTTATVTTAPVPGVKTTIPLNFSVPAGTSLRLVANGATGLTSLIRELTTGFTYPYTLPGVASITSAYTAGASSSYYYYFYDWVAVTACESARTAVSATVNPTASNAAGAVGSTECATATVSGSTEFNFTDCDPIAIINPSGGTPVSGSVNACVKIDASVQLAPNNQPYVQRHYDITPAVNPTTATSTITLYYLQSEFTAFNAARGIYPALPTGSADAAGKANLKITQYGGTGTAPGNYTGTATQIDPADANIVWNAIASRWEITFNATGSGAFYVHTGNFVLPVTIVSFHGEKIGSVNKLSWTSKTETNNAGFELQRSADGIRFSTIGYVATKADNGNSTTMLNYSFDDEKPLRGSNYYRLKQVDRDGKFSYSPTVLLQSKMTEIMFSSVYPNPAQSTLNLVIQSPMMEKLTIVVTDLGGKVILKQSCTVLVGENQQQLNVQALSGGTYFVKAICASGCETAVQRFVKH